MSSIYDALPSSGSSIYDAIPATPVATPAPSSTSIYDRLPSASGLGLVAAPFVAAYKGLTSGFTQTPSVPTTPVPAINTSIPGQITAGVAKGSLDAISDAIMEGGKNLNEQWSTIQNTHSQSALIGANGEIILKSVIAPLFSTLLSPLQGIATIPGVGSVVDGLNKIFGAIGEGSGQAATQVLNEIPMPQATKDNLTPLVHDAASLAGQLVAGDASGEVLSSLRDKAVAITDTVHSQIQGAKSVLDTGPVKSLPVEGESTSTQVPFANQYTPPAELPTIQMGPKAPETLPTIQTEPGYKTPASSPDIQTEQAPAVPNEAVSQTRTVAPNESTDSVPNDSVTPQKTGQVTRTANNINATLVRQGFDALSPEEQSKFTPKSYAESASKVSGLMDDDIEKVKQMARTGKGIPKDVHPQILFNTIEALATKEGDGSLLSDLGRSPLGKKLSEAGSTMGAHAFNDNPNSAVDAIRAVQEARTAALPKGVDAGKVTAKDVETMSSDIKSSRSTPSKWADFAKQIVCNI